jgi:3-dehydroquinate synthase
MSSFPLNVHIDHTLKQLQDYLSGFPAQKEFIILADTNTSHYCLKHLKEKFGESNESRIITISPGEKNKNFEQLQSILSQLADYGADKNTLLINLGGGVICDIGGFAASIYKRGIQYIHIPTSLLAMVDASIGGKNGIDFNGYKNLVGTITLPERVFISKKFLDTLPPVEKSNGVVEALKHGLISDKIYWDKIKEEPIENVEELINTSVKIKSAIVVGDLNEKADRKKLNAGHTIGHAIEAWKLEQDEPIAHGEAVAAGLIMECYISNRLGYLSEEQQAEIEKVLMKTTDIIDLKRSDINDLLKKMRQDKKNEDQKISFSLIRNIGSATYNDHCSDELIKEAVQYYIKK